MSPIVSYAPSNTNAKGWDDKGYSVISPILKKMKYAGLVDYRLINKKPHNIALMEKQLADIGIDEVITGSYHMSSLEYLSMGIVCIANIDKQTSKVLRDLTGSKKLPWYVADSKNFQSRINDLIRKDREEIKNLGAYSRKWMEKYWNQTTLCQHFTDIYEDLL